MLANFAKECMTLVIIFASGSKYITVLPRLVPVIESQYVSRNCFGLIKRSISIGLKQVKLNFFS